MDDIHIYHLEVRDELVESDFNAASPLHVTVVQAGPAATRFTIAADQAGLVGLIRHLHRQRYVILCMLRKENLNG